MNRKVFGFFVIFLSCLFVIRDLQAENIRSITQLPIGQKVSVQGKIVTVRVFSHGTGRTIQINDGTGTIDVLIWSDLFYQIPQRDSLTQGTDIQVQGKLGSYQGRLQIKPEKPEDIQVLSTTSAVVPAITSASAFLAREAVSIPISDVEFICSGPEIYTKTLEAIKDAKKSIYVVMFILRARLGHNKHPITILVSELIAAKKRGVEVHVILDDTLVRGGINISHDTYVMLHENGVDVRFDSPDKLTHTKLVIIDDSITILGSNNWSSSAFNYNNESSLLVRSKEVAKKFKKHFQSIKSIESIKSIK